MPCRYAAGDRSDRGIDADDFQRTALVVGGRRALATAIDRGADPTVFPDDPVPETRRGRQHAWTAGLRGCPVDHGDGDADTSGVTRDEHGTDRSGGDDGAGGHGRPAPSPEHYVFAYLDYEGDVPDAADRRAVETALAELETAFGWGPDGIVASLGYSRRYFDRFESSLPPSVAGSLGAPDRSLVTDGGPVAAGPTDALLCLASDHVPTILAAEQALWGDDPVVDVSLGATFEGVFARPTEPPHRRTAVASGADAVPDPGPGIEPDASAFGGGAIQRVTTLPSGTPSSRSDAETEGCPAHGEGTADSDERSHGTLVGLSPSDPVEFDVTFGGLDDAPPAPVDGHDEAFLVPPVSARALPDLEGDAP